MPQGLTVVTQQIGAALTQLVPCDLPLIVTLVTLDAARATLTLAQLIYSKVAVGKAQHPS
jgi:hypothetical protein